jgi:hypothetical protein
MFFLLIPTIEERGIRTTSMLHDAQMAATRKLQRRIGAIGERQVRAGSYVNPFRQDAYAALLRTTGTIPTSYYPASDAAMRVLA